MTRMLLLPRLPLRIRLVLVTAVLAGLAIIGLGLSVFQVVQAAVLSGMDANAAGVAQSRLLRVLVPGGRLAVTFVAGGVALLMDRPLSAIRPAARTRCGARLPTRPWAPGC